MLKHRKWTIAVVATGLALGLALTGTSLAAKGGNGGGKPGGGDEEVVAKIPLKIILMAGQSNMSSSALSSELETLAPELLVPQTDVPIWYKGSWRDLQPGLGDTTANFGPELTFGRSMATR